MVDDDPPTDPLAGRRADVRRNQQDLVRSLAKLAITERALEAASRGQLRDDAELLAKLDREVEAQRRAIEKRRAQAPLDLKDYRDLVASVRGPYDPRRDASKLEPGWPIVLLPVRLETRFRRTDAGPQLLTRFYPDSCVVDSFEEDLSEAEVSSANQFWADIWRASGNETLERSAWRELVASHGSGRASWIAERYEPLNMGDKPASAPGLLLVIVAEKVLPLPGRAFWEGMWRASGDAAAGAAARATLVAAVGAATAETIVSNPPRNFGDPTPAGTVRASVPVRVSVLLVPPPATLELRTGSWSSAPRIELLPDRFALLAIDHADAVSTWLGGPIARPLDAGPDPNAPSDDQLAAEGDELRVPDGMAWMFDFDRAVADGMGIVADLTADQATRGFKRLIAVGLRSGESPADAAAALGELLGHQARSRAGVEFVPQGTPTNNTEGNAAGFAFRDDADATFISHFKRQRGYLRASDPAARADGEWFARLLGLDDGLISGLTGAGGSDQIEARAMQAALWPGTLGYAMRSLMAPVFDDDTMARTRTFFIEHVSGRGPIPILRIGRQPYGVVLTSAFRRLGWFAQPDRPTNVEPGTRFLAGLYRLVRRVEDDWDGLGFPVSHLGSSGDADQRLLDVIGLAPSSVEYFPLQADGVEQTFYELALFDPGLAAQFLATARALVPMAFLRSFGYTGNDIPDLFMKVWKPLETPLTGPLIDDRPLSEVDPIRAYASGRNYIRWLADAARTGLESLRTERGFDGGRRPAALLYLLLRHALQQGYRDVAISLIAALDAVAATELVREPAFVHVANNAVSESRYELLVRPNPAITGSQTMTLADHITRTLHVLHPEFRAQIEATERLAVLPTARLERLFAESIDTCSYRLDAWKTGLLAARLEDFRAGERPDNRLVRAAGEMRPSAGLHLGFYGWVENLRPDLDALEPVELPDSVRQSVDGKTPPDAPLWRDPANAGFIHAPSMQQAATAAVLRSGSIANPGRLAIDLGSRRVRLALNVLDGMRNGQPLGALLGYQFERHLHDHGPLGVHALIYPLRRRFPLTPNRDASTADSTEAQETIAAQNVVDGRKLIEYAETLGSLSYPFEASLPAAPDAAYGVALDAALAAIRDINDAVADLVLAEGVHQAVLGNIDRSAGTLDAFAKGSHPPVPDFVRSRHSGTNLSLRAAIHLAPPPAGSPLLDIPILTPLARAEPAVNAWLARHLPPPAEVRCRVHFTRVGEAAERTAVYSQADLGMQPIDLLYLADRATDAALDRLDEQLLRVLHRDDDPRLDRPIRVAQVERDGAAVTFFELGAMLAPLRDLLVSSRPLVATDLVRSHDAASNLGSTTLPAGRVAGPIGELRAAGGLLDQLAALVIDAVDPAISVDDAVGAFVAVMADAGWYRWPESGFGMVYEWRQRVAGTIAAKLRSRVDTWIARRGRVEVMLQDYDADQAAMSEAERIACLQAADALVAAQLLAPIPAAVAYRGALAARLAGFTTKLDALRGVVENPGADLGPFLADASALLPLDAFDAEPLSLEDDKAEIDRFRGVMAANAQRALDSVNERLGRVDPLLASAATSSGAAAVDLVRQAGAALFGDDVSLIPEITLPDGPSAEFANAVAYARSGQLTDHLVRDDAVEDWLHGLARVRPKLRSLEAAIHLGEALGAANQAVPLPVQLPFVPGEKWFGLEFAPGATVPADRLLYTFVPTASYAPGDPICGLLIDEWTELIPAETEETGITFHFDRPGAEPPQAWLLALPASADGAWSWPDIVDAITDALDSAKRRAVEPLHLEGTPYSWLVPATTSAYTFPEISISNNLLLAVAIEGIIEAME
ncbi:MAG: hypothetical protein QOE42_1769 [Chloroflexota bacterium]|jgi:hypothetical protein|nr:hypothetical protein [Chloroflexota bacterium]